MFRIPAFNKFDMTFEEAKVIMTNHGRGDLLEGMQAMDRAWEEKNARQEEVGAACLNFHDEVCSDADFYDWYEAEVNAYNVVFSTMKPLFA